MKNKRAASFISAVEARFPGLVGAVRTMIEASERQFGARSGSGAGESYLWEHTTHVASLAFELARSEKTDPLIPALVALFHDAGKFAGGTYHQGKKAEEEEAAAMAGRVLGQFGAGAAQARRVASGLRALYNSRAKRNRAADIVHDADFLSKFGTMGIAQFFIKSTLRGRTLEQAISNQLSKELTYAACLPSNMRTRAGKRQAEKKSTATLQFFRALLRELREAHVGDFVVRRIRVKPSGRPGSFIEVRLAVPRSCTKCGGPWKIAFKTEPGTKCEKLEAEITCLRCGEKARVSFCLPEVSPPPRRGLRTDSAPPGPNFPD